METIRIKKGATHTLFFNFTDQNGVLDVSTYLFTFTVKKRCSQTDAQASLQKTNSSFEVALGSVTLALSSSDTKIDSGSYVCDLQWNNAGSIDFKKFNLIVDGEVTISE